MNRICAGSTAPANGWPNRVGMTAPEGDGASPLAAERSSPPVGKLNAVSSGQANTGVSKETNLYCAWKPSGATDAGISCSPIIISSTPPKTEMRTSWFRLDPSRKERRLRRVFSRLPMAATLLPFAWYESLAWFVFWLARRLPSGNDSAFLSAMPAPNDYPVGSHYDRP